MRKSQGTVDFSSMIHKETSQEHSDKRDDMLLRKVNYRALSVTQLVGEVTVKTRTHTKGLDEAPELIHSDLGHGAPHDGNN